MLKKLKSCLGGTDKKTIYTHFARFAKRHLSAQPSFVYYEMLFSEAGNVYEQKRYRLLTKTGENFYIFIKTLNNKNKFFCSFTALI